MALQKSAKGQQQRDSAARVANKHSQEKRYCIRIHIYIHIYIYIYTHVIYVYTVYKYIYIYIFVNIDRYRDF